MSICFCPFYCVSELFIGDHVQSKTKNVHRASLVYFVISKEN